MNIRNFVLCLIPGLIFASSAGILLSSCSTSDYWIKPCKATGQSEAGYEPINAIDNDDSSYFMTIAADKDESVNRYIDFQFDSLYSFHLININQFLPNTKFANTYNYFEIYISSDGKNFKKIAYKADNQVALPNGNTYVFNNSSTYYGGIIRVNLSFNSWWDYDSSYSGMQSAIQSIKFMGHKVGTFIPRVDNVSITDWDQTNYADFYDKFTNDNNFKYQNIYQELSKLVERILGEQYVNKFTFTLTPSTIDTYTIENNGAGLIKITGNNGVSLASGFNYYIKNYLHIDYNPMVYDTINTYHGDLPAIEGIIQNTSNYTYRYILNYCTYSYSMAFWGWKEWQAFLDWCAMNGVNIMLDITGQEEALRETLLSFNYSDKEARDYIAGPAYQAWFMMGNMTGLGGPLSSQWFEQRVELARKIHQEQLIYGITPVMQGWCGSVPDDFDIKNPNTEVFHSRSWLEFNHHQNLLDSRVGHSEKTFLDFYKQYYDNQTHLFGNITDWRSADPFHERSYSDISHGTQKSADIYVSVIKAMKLANPNYHWLMQDWQGSVAQSDLQALENIGANEHILVLDLYGDVSPEHGAMENTNTPWIFNTINNFGGRMGLYGRPMVYWQNIPFQQTTGNMMLKGIGFAPEGFGTAPMLNEELFDLNWISDRNGQEGFNNWIDKYLDNSYDSNKYSEEKMDNIKTAWEEMMDEPNNSVYDPDMGKANGLQGAPESPINAKPSLYATSASEWGGFGWTTEDNGMYDIWQPWRALINLLYAYNGSQDSDNTPNFLFDLVDVARQTLQNKILRLLWEIRDEFTSKESIDDYEQKCNTFLSICKYTDQLLSKVKGFTLNNWVEQARGGVLENMDDWTKDQNEWNARMLVSTWAGSRQANAGHIADYSNRQWSGVINQLYLQRWYHFFHENKFTDVNEYTTNDWFRYEWQWANIKSDETYVGSIECPFDNFDTNSKSIKEIIDEFLPLL